jgi:hypothetical protein
MVVKRGTPCTSILLVMETDTNSLLVSKKAEFHVDFKSIKKFLKNVPKNVISKNVTEICTFSTFTHVRQNLFCFIHTARAN